MLKRLVVIVAVAGLSGCQSYPPGPTVEQSAAADYGRPMSQAECERVATAAVSRTMIDPESVRVRDFSTCRKNALPSRTGQIANFGYFTKFQLNGANPFGGMAGYRQVGVLMRDGRAVERVVYFPGGGFAPY